MFKNTDDIVNGMNLCLSNMYGDSLSKFNYTGHTIDYELLSRSMERLSLFVKGLSSHQSRGGCGKR
ncbi:MAG: hypothetical protein J6X22_03780 [Muribaculaceae bacterium]|nr:hypothetical protein [Muribaculaceae bacterium]